MADTKPTDDQYASYILEAFKTQLRMDLTKMVQEILEPQIQELVSKVMKEMNFETRFNRSFETGDLDVVLRIMDERKKDG